MSAPSVSPITSAHGPQAKTNAMAKDGMNEVRDDILPLGKSITNHMTCDCHEKKQYTGIRISIECSKLITVALSHLYNT